MQTCFSIMPFRKDFKEIDEIIAASAKKCGLEYVRGDLSNKPGSIMPQIVHEIKRAAVVVADISGHNPNVFYELGIAHEIKGQERVVIITREINDTQIFDIDQLRQFQYEHNRAGRMHLRKVLPQLISRASKSSADQEYWNVIRGRVPRTHLIVRDIELLLKSSGPKKLKNTFIRVTAGLSSIAISDHEPVDTELGIDYFEALLAERNMLRKALLKGVRLKAILNPPLRFTQVMLIERLRIRYQRLIGLFQGRSDIKHNRGKATEDVRAMKQCEFVFSPIPMPNVFIIGNEVAYEGMKRAGTGGYEVTHCETSPEGLRELISQFDKFFNESQREMLRMYPPDGCLAEQLQSSYDEAMLHANMR